MTVKSREVAALPRFEGSATSLSDLESARQRSAIARSDRGLEVLRWNEAFAVLDHEALLKGPSFERRLDELGIDGKEVRKVWRNIVPTTEGAHRTRLRVPLAGLLRMRSVEKLRQPVADAVDRSLDEIAQQGDTDLMQSLCWKVPARVYCHLVAAPDSLAADFARISDSVITPVLGFQPKRRDESHRAFLEALDLVRVHLARRREHLGDDFTSALIGRHLSGDLDEDELLGESLMLLFASQDNTVHQMGLVVGTLLGVPGLWKRLAETPTLVAAAVEEAIRLAPRFGTVFRLAPEDAVIDGLAVEKGTWVFVSVRSAQRDEQEFEDPNAFRLDRPHKRSLMFGGGPYNCLGQHLARLEIQAVVQSMARRYPQARLLEPMETKISDAVTEVRRLRVSLTAQGTRRTVQQSTGIADSCSSRPNRKSDIS